MLPGVLFSVDIRIKITMWWSASRTSPARSLILTPRWCLHMFTKNRIFCQTFALLGFAFVPCERTGSMVHFLHLPSWCQADFLHLENVLNVCIFTFHFCEEVKLWITTCFVLVRDLKYGAIMGLPTITEEVVVSYLSWLDLARLVSVRANGHTLSRGTSPTWEGSTLSWEDRYISWEELRFQNCQKPHGFWKYVILCKNDHFRTKLTILRQNAR